VQAAAALQCDLQLTKPHPQLAESAVLNDRHSSSSSSSMEGLQLCGL
jgi:hypothetical protein